MVFSDALAEEIFQILAKLPYGTVSPTIDKMKAEVAIQQEALSAKQKPASEESETIGSVRAKQFQEAIDKNKTASESVRETHDRLRREGAIGAQFNPSPPQSDHSHIPNS